MPPHLHSVCKVLIGNKLNQGWTREALDANDAPQILFGYEKAEIVTQCAGRSWTVVTLFCTYYNIS